MKNMRINKTIYKNRSQQEYNIIIDVRTPLEFKEDHIPNSINYPVLTNKQRHEIGIEYKENSFYAKKVGASIISSNISKIINKIKFDKKQKILIYCWRGGLRSLSLYLVLKQIGYDVTLLDGGYKNYRRFVVKFFETSCEKYKFNQIMGVTGVGKTLFIKELSKTYQVIDFEGLANHKGSILGNIPNKIQPSQKYFETLIYEKIKSFNSKKNIWVESESIKVGKLSIPSKIWKNMPLGKNVKVISSLEERVRFILKDYKYFTNTPTLMKEALKVLRKIIPKEEFLMIEENLKKEKYFQFVKSLIEYHYDRAYKKTRAESVSNIFNEIYLDKINLLHIKRAIKQNNYF